MLYISLCTKNGELTQTQDVELLKKALKHDHERIWVDMDDPTDDEIVLLSTVFNFHDLAVEQVIQQVDIPKIEVYENYVFMVLHRIFYQFDTEQCQRREFEVFFSDRFIVTIHTPQLSRTFSTLREMVRQSPKDLLGNGTSYVLLKLLSLAIRDYLPVIEEWQDTLDTIEQQVLKGQHEKILDQILQFKKLVATMRKSLLPERGVIQQLHERSNHTFLTTEAKRRFHSLMDDWSALLRELDSLKEHASSVFEVYAAMLTIQNTETSNKLNFVMQRLTIGATIFLPLTFIVGVYGMNFEYMPEFQWKGFYYILWGFMITLVAVMLIFFKRKKWL